MGQLTDIFDRDVVMSYQTQDPIKRSPFFQTGVAQTSPKLAALLAAGSQTFTVPYVGGIDGNLEANYSNTIYTDIAVPRGISGKEMAGRVAYLNEGFYEASLERYLTGVSPLQALAKYIDGVWDKQLEVRFIATLNGIRGAAGAAITTTKTTAYDVNAFLEAEGTLPTDMQYTGAMVVHPVIATKMRTQNLIEKVTTSADLPPVEFYNGRRVIVSANGTKAGTDYITILLNDGAFSVEGMRGDNDLEMVRSPQRGNGGGVNELWTRYNALIHPTGFSFIADPATLTGGTTNESISASWADLNNKANWQLTLDAAEQVPVRFLITKA